MRKFALLMLVFLLSVTVVFAQDSAPIVINWQEEVNTVTGTVLVTGTVNPEGFQSYFLEVAIYTTDENDTPFWLPISLPSIQPIVDGTLGEWNTLAFEDGLYQLRLHVILMTGESIHYILAPIAIANNGAVEVAGNVQIVESPDGVVASAPIELTATPDPFDTIPSPEILNDLPIEVGGHVRYFTEDTASIMRATGLTWVKWQSTFTLDGNLDVARDRINAAHEAGFKILLGIKGEVADLEAMGDEYYPLFAEFLGDVARLGVDAIEVWNEMNIEREWPRGRISPDSYVEMLRQASVAIRASNSDTIIITGALAPTGAEGAFGLDRVWNDDRYTAGMVAAGAADYSDCIGIHYNEGVLPPTSLGGDPRGEYPTRYLPQMLDRVGFPFRNQDTALCFTEIGYLSPDGYDPLPAGFEWGGGTSVEEQAEWLAGAIQVIADYERLPVRLMIIWNIDFDNYEDDPQAGFAILRPDGSCPACETILALRDR